MEPLVNVFPNPADDYVHIELSSNVSISFIEIVNIQGKLIIHKKTVNNQKPLLDVSNLPNGLHIIKMHTDNGSVMKIFIKQ